jgi:hypothetical protein
VAEVSRPSVPTSRVSLARGCSGQAPGGIKRGFAQTSTGNGEAKDELSPVFRTIRILVLPPGAENVAWLTMLLVIVSSASTHGAT